MRLNRAATDGAQTAGVARRRLGAGAIRVLSVTAVAAAACSLWAGAASAATAAPAAGGTATTTTITNTPNPGTVNAGDSFTIDVTVKGAGGTPTGSVTVTPSDNTLPPSYTCSNTLTDGAMSCKVTPGTGTFGDIDYTATYSGDTTFAGSTSGTFVLIVPETTTTDVSPATATPGSVTLTATVTSQAMDNISPDAGGSGTVTFYNDGTVISTACAAASLTYDGGGANLATCKTTLAAGKYTITAKYSGDPNNLASSGSEPLTVANNPPPAKHATKTHGSASPKNAKVRHWVTLSSTVTSSGGTPGGKITFMSAGRVLCAATLSHGKAHCSYKFKAAGTHQVRAWYAGSSTFDKSHSGFFAVKVKK
jgi:hypothetical protein